MTNSFKRPVHPHARGEHSAAPVGVDGEDGSSPRPWGTRHQYLQFGAMVRFIPTPVGNTSWPTTRCASGAVHPHARGEHFRDIASSSNIGGSSPRPWGTRTMQASSSTLMYGSSPRPWGTRASRPRVVPPARFIPTPVGNTWRPNPPPPARPVHPHARGEHRFAAIHELRHIGSSPRPWGTQAVLVVPSRRIRFIPTPVGNTQGFADVLTRARGSSPRPWGTRPGGRPGAALGRFIPTPVGNTARPRRRSRRSPVHPHARGEHGRAGGPRG